MDLLDRGLAIGDGIYSLTDPIGGQLFDAYCDMSTDGGGWTLVGRGRENWDWTDSGRNTENVTKNVGTNAAFTPAYYSATFINQILQSKVIKDLPDGIRLKRAYNSTGTVYQEARWLLANLTSWSWLFDNSFALSSFILQGSSLSPANTRDNLSVQPNDANRIFTWAWPDHNNLRGFSYGQSFGGGSNNTTNFLWQFANESHAVPYTEVYVRPEKPPTLAYSVTSGTSGNQTYSGNLGMDFNVGTTPIQVFAVGYFTPANAIPPNGYTINVGIFNRANATLVNGTQKAFSASVPGSAIPGTAMRISYLDPPITLAANGQFTIVAQGYGSAYANGNGWVSGSNNFSTTNSGSYNRISFVGKSRYVNGNSLQYPTILDISISQYGAGTFLYR